MQFLKHWHNYNKSRCIVDTWKQLIEGYELVHRDNSNTRNIPCNTTLDKHCSKGVREVDAKVFPNNTQCFRGPNLFLLSKSRLCRGPQFTLQYSRFSSFSLDYEVFEKAFTQRPSFKEKESNSLALEDMKNEGQQVHISKCISPSADSTWLTTFWTQTQSDPRDSTRVFITARAVGQVGHALSIQKSTIGTRFW